MRRSHAPSILVGERSVGASQAPEEPTDQSKSSALLPARNKRKFVAPASVAPGQTASAAGVTRVQRCKTMPAAQQQQGKDGPSNPSASAQYFSVLYTKRATNKVCAAALSAPKLSPTRGASFQKKKNKSYSDGVLEVKEGNACTLFTEASCRLPLSNSKLADC